MAGPWPEVPTRFQLDELLHTVQETRAQRATSAVRSMDSPEYEAACTRHRAALDALQNALDVVYDALRAGA